MPDGPRSSKEPSNDSRTGCSSRSRKRCGWPLSTRTQAGLRMSRLATSGSGRPAVPVRDPVPAHPGARPRRPAGPGGSARRRQQGWGAWPDATFVRVANSNHITAQADFLHCVSVIVRQFVGTRSAGDTSCARHVPAQYVVPAFPTSVGKAPQAVSAGTSDHSTSRPKPPGSHRDDRRRPRALVQLARRTRIRPVSRFLQGVRCLLLLRPPGAALQVDPFRAQPEGLRNGNVEQGVVAADGKVEPDRTNGLKGIWQIEWPTSEAGAIASEEGTISGQSVALEMPAPFSAHG